MRYAVVFEKAAGGSFSAYPPGLPGCGVVGESLDEARRLIVAAIEMHIAGMREDGEVIPPPGVVAAEFVEVPDVASAA
jgi:predicted RNase H-like HicB family nuclease